MTWRIHVPHCSHRAEPSTLVAVTVSPSRITTATVQWPSITTTRLAARTKSTNRSRSVGVPSTRRATRDRSSGAGLATPPWWPGRAPRARGVRPRPPAVVGWDPRVHGEFRRCSGRGQGGETAVPYGAEVPGWMPRTHRRCGPMSLVDLDRPDDERIVLAEVVVHLREIDCRSIDDQQRLAAAWLRVHRCDAAVLDVLEPAAPSGLPGRRRRPPRGRRRRSRLVRRIRSAGRLRAPARRRASPPHAPAPRAERDRTGAGRRPRLTSGAGQRPKVGTCSWKGGKA